MKLKNKITAIAFMLFFSFAFAQKAPSKRAKKVADEMAEVLQLNSQDAVAIYQIQLERFEQSDSIKEEYANQPKVRKEKLKQVGNKVYNDLKNYLGKERLSKWREYKKSKKN